MDSTKKNNSLSDLLFGSSPPPRPITSSSLLDTILSTSRPKPASTPLQALFMPTNKIRVASTPFKRPGVLLNVVPQSEQALRSRIKSDTLAIINRRTATGLARIVPEAASVGFEEGKLLETAVLYVDIRDSTSITAKHSTEVAAKIYQIFHKSMTLTVRQKYGKIRGHHGDRIMAVFEAGNSKRSQAVQTAILLQKVIQEDVNPFLKKAYGHPLDCGIGVDFGKMLVVKVGIQGANNNDLVWAGRVANRASKLADIGSGIYISKDVYDSMFRTLKQIPFHSWESQLSLDMKIGQFYHLKSLLLPPIV